MRNNKICLAVIGEAKTTEKQACAGPSHNERTSGCRLLAAGRRMDLATLLQQPAAKLLPSMGADASARLRGTAVDNRFVFVGRRG
jgi:hypothetical protein